MTALLLALGLGFVSGLRTFTPVAAVMLVRGGFWGIVLAVAAVGEYVVDVLPNTPSRTQAMGLSARVVSGAFVGWMIATMHDGAGMFGCRHRRGSNRHVRWSRCASRSDRPHRRLSCRDRGRPRRDRTRGFHRHTLGPCLHLNAENGQRGRRVNAGDKTPTGIEGRHQNGLGRGDKAQCQHGGEPGKG